MVQGIEHDPSRATPEGERRLVTVLFADLVGYTTMSETRDPELIMETISLCFEAMSADIRRYGGYVDKVVGDEIMALFGAPRAQEDDAGKAVAAGLAMQRTLVGLTALLEQRLGSGMKMRVGINTGLVVTGAVGPGGYTVTGDAVNVAARLEKAAEPGEVLVGEMTRRLARRQFEWGERQTLTVKGRTEPVDCFTVDRPSTALLRLVPSPSDTPYVGRGHLMEQLAAVWRDTEREDARIVELVGEAGVGKTRLLANFFARTGTSADQVLYARADTPPRTFGPLLQLMPSLHSEISPAMRKRLEAVAREDAPEADPDWLVDCLVEILGALSAERPVAMVLDDIHRADTATLEVIDRLMPKIAGMRVCTFLLRQPQGRRPRKLPRADTIVVDALMPDESRALVRAVVPDLPAPTIETICGRAGGNPLYLEVLSAAAATAPDGVSVPASLQTAVTARVDELDELSRQVLREASVFGHSFLEEPLRRVMTVMDGFYESLDHLCQSGLLDRMPGDTRGYVFRHSLVHEVLYEGLLRRRRTDLHRRAAESLELTREEGIDIEPEQIAYHLERAGDSTRAAAYHLAAADRADRLRAPVEARSHRRTANRLIAMASLGELYTQGRPGRAARAGAVAGHLLLSLGMMAPLFLFFALRKPSQDHLTLGLPTDIIGFNLSSVLIAVAIGGAPLLLSGVLYSHLAAPSLMRRRVSAPSLAAWVAGGWALALASVLVAYGLLIALLRFGALDRLSSMYVGGATLQMMLGDYSLIVLTFAGTLAAAILWTALLRVHAYTWARARRRSVSPRATEASREWLLVRQLGLMAAIVSLGSLALVSAYQVRLLGNDEFQTTLPSGTFAVVAAGAGLFALIAIVAVVISDQRLRAGSVRQRFGLLGFEVPLIIAAAFGVMAWYSMRHAVIVSANDVDTPGSLSAYNRAVDLFPSLGIARYLRGERRLAGEDLDGARADFERAAELDPGFPATYLPLAVVQISQGETELGIQTAGKLIELRPEHPGGYAIRAWGYSQQNDLIAAAADFERATGPLPDGAKSWDAYFIRCFALVQVQEYQRARPECERVLELNPNQFITLDLLGQLNYELENYEASISYYDRMLEVQPANAQALLNRGSAQWQLKRYADAESDFTRAADADPELAEVFVSRANIRLFLDDEDGAWEDAQRAAALDPANDGTLVFVATYTGRYQTTLDEATRLIAEQERPPAYLFLNRSLANTALGNFDAAIADASLGIEANPGSVAGYDRRGFAKLRKGDLAGAEQDLDEALRGIASITSPQTRSELHYHRALLLQAQGQPERALLDIEEALKNVEYPSSRRVMEDLRRSLQ